MKVELIESVDEFISTTTAFRATDPLRTNVIGSVALSVAEGDLLRRLSLVDRTKR